MNTITFGEHPSDKEELGAVLNRDQTEHGVEYVAAEAYRQLETENAELKRQVGELKELLNRKAAALDLWVEVVNLKELVGRKSGAIELWKEENAELRRQLDEVKQSQISIRCNRRNRDKTLPTWEEVNDFVAELHGDNKELKRQLAEFRRTEPLKIAERNELRAKVVEYERQIAEGELVPVALAYDIVGDFHMPGNGWQHFEDYAKMRVKEAKRKAAK